MRVFQLEYYYILYYDTLKDLKISKYYAYFNGNIIEWPIITKTS